MVGQEYAHPLDRSYHLPELDSPDNNYITTPPTISDLKPSEVGTTTSPFEHSLKSLSAKIKEGASKVEFEFFGTGKGTSQSFTPESFGKKEREDIRYLAKINKVKTTTHATPTIQGYSGFNKQTGMFDDQLRQSNLKEINKAIDFAAEATTGGAVVMHTGEWQRSIKESFGKGKDKFREYENIEGEKEADASFYMVDETTGKLQAIKKDQDFFEPEFFTAEDVKDKLERNSNGQLIDSKGNILDSEDWVDLDNNRIDPLNPEALFERIPKFDEDKTQFKSKKLTFNDMKKRAERISKQTNRHLPTEKYIFRNQFINEASKAKANSLYHGRQYKELLRTRENLKETIKNAKKMKEKHIPPERWKDYFIDKSPLKDHAFSITDKKDPIEVFEDELHQVNDSLRHIHDSSATADAQAKELIEKAKNVQTVEEYGLKRTADTFSRAAERAWEQNNRNKKHLEEDIFIAPENYLPQEFGGHPQELTKIVEKSRSAFANRMMQKHKMNKKEAEKLANKHIKSTIDIGHFNLWRQHFERNSGESLDNYEKRFNKWIIGEIKQMSKKGVLGHVHIADNFGYDDEHLTPGEGNVPIKEFVKLLKKEGVRDIVIEPGSFNPLTSMHDAWSEIGVNTYGMSSMRPRSFSRIHQQHFGYNAPPFYIVGAYSPSNDFKLWSEVPLE